MRRVAFAEQQPVVVDAGIDAGLEQGAQLGFQNLRTLQAQANATHAKERVLLSRHRPVRQGFVAADIQRTHHQRAPGEGIKHAPVLALLRGVIRGLGDDVPGAEEGGSVDVSRER